MGVRVKVGFVDSVGVQRGWATGSRLGLWIVLGCKGDKIFLWAPLVPMDS